MDLPTQRRRPAEAVAGLMGTDMGPLLAVQHSPLVTFRTNYGNDAGRFSYIQLNNIVPVLFHSLVHRSCAEGRQRSMMRA